MLAGWRRGGALPRHCLAAAARPLLELCAGYAKQSAAAARGSKAAPAKAAAGDERIEGKTQKLLKVRRSPPAGSSSCDCMWSAGGAALV